MTLDLVGAVDADDHTRGVSGRRQVVVYGDFECPYTAPTMREIGRLLEGGAAFEVVFRHFPLRSIHPHAQASAEAAEAAARQGRFWEMHDLLFRNQARLEPDDLQRYVERIGLDLARFDSDLLELGDRHSRRTGRRERYPQRRRRDTQPVHRRHSVSRSP